jgi:hypothetical protein
MRINGRASMLNDAEAKARNFGAQLMVRIECEIYPNCPRYVPDLAGEGLSPYFGAKGREHRRRQSGRAAIMSETFCQRRSARGGREGEHA